MKQVSDDLKNAGRIDGLSEYTIFFRLVLPLVRPAMATVAVFTMIPIWNDLWFPLILAPAKQPRPSRSARRCSSASSSDQLERGACGAVAGDPAGAHPLPHLLAAADPRHHLGSGQMNSEKPLRVLVAGLGNMGRSHALAYHNNPGFEIAALVNRSDVPLPAGAVAATASALVRRRACATRSPTSSRSTPIPTAMPTMPSWRWRRAATSSSRSRWRRRSPMPSAWSRRPRPTAASWSSATSCATIRPGCG